MTAKEQLVLACPTVSVGILTADLLNLGSELRVLEQAGVPLVHIDVMDGVFCPQMTVGPAFIKALKTPLLKDVHLMIADPVDKLESFVAAGADIITVHAETPHVHRSLQALGKMTNANDPARGIVRGLGLNPGTPLAAVEPVLDELEMVVLLAVNPGFPGQSFIDATAARVGQLIEMISRSGRDVLVCVDGGIKKDNVKAVAAMGADLVVTGSAVFDGKAAPANAAFMLEAVRS
ncbi:MAG: ribulose-phosphate 3-epimerase [Phycisphaerae bacterium]